MEDNEARWVEEDDGSYYYYYSDGTMATGWMQDGDNWYYFDDNGKMSTGWAPINGDWYYFYSTGEMATSWVNDGDGWYYFYGNGSMAWGKTINGYLLNNSGKMVTGTGWQYQDGDSYYLKDDKEVTGWLQDDDNWYYFYGNGSMAWGRTVDGYYLDASGKWIPDDGNSSDEDNSSNVGDTSTGWKCIDGDWYYYYSDGKMATGWLKDGNSWYYLDPSSGVMQTGCKQIDGDWYYLNEKGVMQTGTVTINDGDHDGAYEFDSSGKWIPGPTKEEAADIAADVYFEDYDEVAYHTVSGWTLTNHYTPYGYSLQIGIYERKGLDGKTEYVVANRGSRMPSLSNREPIQDWKNNWEQLKGKSEDVAASVVFVKGFVDFVKKKNDDAHITFVGHSKGGAEALINAVATDKNAIVFNPAAPDFVDIGLEPSKYSGKATSYVVRGEILNDHQGEEALDEVGNVIYLRQQYEFWRTNSDYSYLDEDTINLHDLEASINNHLMDAVKAALEQYDSN